LDANVEHILIDCHIAGLIPGDQARAKIPHVQGGMIEQRC
jgi:hypothetical protein